ncbi:MAG: hypothetical protein FWB85_01840 [Chitinispirillia bacterium]|nr:hypothetical protein [Chitinispirillia bacterium]MCL2241104.1 hypothetical protein [Chitinispirillia bacterium]
MRLRCFAVLICFAALAHGSYTIEPAVMRINVNMGENTAFTDIVHTGGPPAAIELTVFERRVDLEGETVTDSLVQSKDFMIYPSEIILYPGESARVQFAYKGRKPKSDVAYLLFSREVSLPIETGGEGVRIGVDMLMNYYTIISLETNSRGALSFVSSREIGDGKIEVIVENRSNGRVPIDRWAIVVGKQKITNFTGTKNSIMPGQQRRLTFEFGRPLKAKDLRFENK